MFCPSPVAPFPPFSFGTKRKPPRAGARSPRGPPAANTEGRGEAPGGNVGWRFPRAWTPTPSPSHQELCMSSEQP